jgi:hypothetical protein
MEDKELIKLKKYIKESKNANISYCKKSNISRQYIYKIIK